MKTLKFLIVLCIIATFAMDNINAQNGVVKLEASAPVGGQLIPCTGDRFAPGSIVTAEMMIMENKMLVKVRDVTLIGIPSGKEYVVSQVVSLTDDRVSHVEYRIDGKLVAVGEVVIRTIENANGEVTADIDHVKFICK